MAEMLHRLAASSRVSAAVNLPATARSSQLGRIAMDLDDADMVRVLARVQVWPLTREIARESTRLDIGGDPGDQLICAHEYRTQSAARHQGSRAAEIEAGPAGALTAADAGVRGPVAVG